MKSTFGSRSRQHREQDPTARAAAVAGYQVRRGQVPGLVGNSGLSSEPHPHFHVMDGPGVPARLGGDGVPYVFERFTFDAHITGLEDRPEPTVAPAAPPRERRGQYPFT